MSFLGWIIIGGIAGWIASIFTSNNERMGLLSNIVVGIIGSFIGGFVVNLLGGTGVTGFNIWSLIVSVIGATIFLWFINLIRRK